MQEYFLLNVHIHIPTPHHLKIHIQVAVTNLVALCFCNVFLIVVDTTVKMFPLLFLLFYCFVYILKSLSYKIFCKNIYC